MRFEAPNIEYATISPMLVVFGLAIAGVLVEAFAPRAKRYLIQVVLAAVIPLFATARRVHTFRDARREARAAQVP